MGFAISEIDHQSKNHPGKCGKQSSVIERIDHGGANKNTQDGNQRNQWCFKWTNTFRIIYSHHPNTTQTNTKANKVPMLVRSPATLPGIKAEKVPTNTNRIKFDLYGVLYFLWRSENAFGNRPSVDMV